MKFDLRSKKMTFSILMLSGLFLCSGCATLQTGSGNSRASADVADSQTFVVDIHNGVGKPARWQGPVTKGMTVQGALEASGALAKVKNPDIELSRPVPESGMVLKMSSQMQPGKKAVKYEHDYAIHPGDHIVVKPGANLNPLEKFVGDLF